MHAQAPCAKVSMEEFLESCRATSLLAELEDDEELPEADEEDEDENEEDCEDNYDEETSESSRSLLRSGHYFSLLLFPLRSVSSKRKAEKRFRFFSKIVSAPTPQHWTVQ